MNRKTLIYIGLIAAMIIWGTSYIATGKAFEYKITPFTLVFSRLVLGGGLLFLYSRFTGKLQNIRRKDWGLFLALSLFEPFFYYIGESYGILFTSASTTSVIIATIPVFTPFVMLIFYREKTSLFNLFGVLTSFLGVLLIIFNDNYSLEASPKGLAFIFFAVFSALGYTVLMKKITARYNSYTIVTYQSLIGIFLFLPLVLINDVSSFGNVNWCWELFAYIAVLAVFATVFAYIVFSTGIRELGSTRVMVFTNAIPVITAIASSMLGLENLPMKKLTGVLIVVLGVFLSQSKKPFLGVPELLYSYFFRKGSK